MRLSDWLRSAAKPELDNYPRYVHEICPGHARGGRYPHGPNYFSCLSRYSDEVRDGFQLPVQLTLEHQADVYYVLGAYYLTRGLKARLKMPVGIEASAQTIGPLVLLGQCQTTVRR